MQNLRYLELEEGVLEDFLNDNLFPNLLECQYECISVTSTTYTRTEWPQVPHNRFPHSLKAVVFHGSLESTAVDPKIIHHFLWQLLQALYVQFGTDYDHGLIEICDSIQPEGWSVWHHVVASISEEDLDGTISRRLILKASREGSNA